MLMKRDERVKHVSPDDSKQAGRDGNRILQQRFMPEDPRRWCERFPTAPPSPPRFAVEIGVCHRAPPRSAAALRGCLKSPGGSRLTVRGPGCAPAVWKLESGNIVGEI